MFIKTKQPNLKIRLIIAQFLLSSLTFVILFSGCSDKENKEKEKNLKLQKNTDLKNNSKNTPVKPIIKKAQITTVQIPKSAFAWGVIPNTELNLFLNGWGSTWKPTSEKSTFFVLLINSQGAICSYPYIKAKSEDKTCLKIGDVCHTLPEPAPAISSLKNVKLNLEVASLKVNFNSKTTKPLYEKFKTLEKLHLGNFKISFKKDLFKLVAKPSKKVISKDFRNAMFYWKQMAIEGRTHIFRMGTLGKKLSKALPSSKIVSKKRRIEFIIPIDAKTLGWTLHELSTLYNPLCTLTSPPNRSQNAK
jgi:hypothetical protein